MKSNTFTLPTVKARQGVPAALAARYAVRAIPNKKGRGSYTRKPQAEA